MACWTGANRIWLIVQRWGLLQFASLRREFTSLVEPRWMLSDAHSRRLASTSSTRTEAASGSVFVNQANNTRSWETLLSSSMRRKAHGRTSDAPLRAEQFCHLRQAVSVLSSTYQACVHSNLCRQELWKISARRPEPPRKCSRRQFRQRSPEPVGPNRGLPMLARSDRIRLCARPSNMSARPASRSQPTYLSSASIVLSLNGRIRFRWKYPADKAAPAASFRAPRPPRQARAVERRRDRASSSRFFRKRQMSRRDHSTAEPDHRLLDDPIGN